MKRRIIISNFNIFTPDFEINCNKYINLIISKIINIVKISFIYPQTKLLNNLILAPLYKSSELLILNEQVLNGHPYDYPTKKELSIVHFKEAFATHTLARQYLTITILN